MCNTFKVVTGVRFFYVIVSQGELDWPIWQLLEIELTNLNLDLNPRDMKWMPWLWNKHGYRKLTCSHIFKHPSSKEIHFFNNFCSKIEEYKSSEEKHFFNNFCSKIEEYKSSEIVVYNTYYKNS